MTATFFSIGAQKLEDGKIRVIVWDIEAEGETAGCASIRDIVEGPEGAVREYLYPYLEEAQHVRIGGENVRVEEADVFEVALANATDAD